MDEATYRVAEFAFWVGAAAGVTIGGIVTVISTACRYAYEDYRREKFIEKINAEREYPTEDLNE